MFNNRKWRRKQWHFKIDYAFCSLSLDDILSWHGNALSVGRNSNTLNKTTATTTTSIIIATTNWTIKIFMIICYGIISKHGHKIQHFQTNLRVLHLASTLTICAFFLYVSFGEHREQVFRDRILICTHSLYTQLYLKKNKKKKKETKKHQWQWWRTCLCYVRIANTMSNVHSCVCRYREIFVSRENVYIFALCQFDVYSFCSITN